MTLDLTGSSPQAAGPVNCGFTQTVAAARVAYKLLICSDMSPSGGSFRALEVAAPQKTIFRAQEPAPCGWYFTPLGLLIDLIVKALAPVMPERVAGALRILDYGIRQDSGGAGEFRGGNGTYREYRVESDSALWLWIERSDTPAWGLFDGESGAGPVVEIRRPGEAVFRRLKANDVKVPRGTVIRGMTGGSGYGRAFDRDPLAVREDVLDGFVSVARAGSAYGVTLDENGVVNETATRERRSQQP